MVEQGLVLAPGLQWIQPLYKPVRRLGILAGTFNPPTRAHVSLAQTALHEVDAVIFVLPARLPHKEMSGASLTQRAGMLAQVAGLEQRFAALITPHGLFAEIAHELREQFGPSTELSFVCGRDAAERIVTWPYDDPAVLPRFFTMARLLVARRHGVYTPPPEFAEDVQALEFPEEWDAVSSTELRRRIASGEPWEMLVPEPIVESVRAIYS